MIYEIYISKGAVSSRCTKMSDSYIGADSPFYFGQLLRPHGIKSGIRKNIRASFVRGGKEQPMAVTVRRLCRFAGHYINAGIRGSTFSLYAECDFVE